MFRVVICFVVALKSYRDFITSKELQRASPPQSVPVSWIALEPRVSMSVQRTTCSVAVCQLRLVCVAAAL